MEEEETVETQTVTINRITLLVIFATLVLSGFLIGAIFVVSQQEKPEDEPTTNHTVAPSAKEELKESLQNESSTSRTE
jgi:cytoskeletal protein RodZ